MPRAILGSTSKRSNFELYEPSSVVWRPISFMFQYLVVTTIRPLSHGTKETGSLAKAFPGYFSDLQTEVTCQWSETCCVRGASILPVEKVVELLRDIALAA